MYTHDTKDWRNISFGKEIPSEMYTDQPYLVKTNDDAWLCTLTTGPGHEGRAGQHVVSMRSTDRGETWQDWCDIEPGTLPESAYSVLLKTPSGRIFVFYGYNEANIRHVPAIDNDPPFFGKAWRVDCTGEFVFRYSDDHGRSWSTKRYKIPVREMACDRNNTMQGKIRYFWNVGRPFFRDGSCFLPMIKIGSFGNLCYNHTEGVLIQCPNIESQDPEKFEWITLPDGDHGIGHIAGGKMVSEEHCFVPMSDGSFFCNFRTIDSHPGCAYSRDNGHTWSKVAYMRYGNGKLIKHPRAANFVWKCGENRYLYWFHNHGGNNFCHRNPAWVCPGIEVDSPEGKIIKWGEPEILLYDHDPNIRMSYPDLLIDNGVFVSETQKKIAKLHQIDDNFLERIFLQFSDGKPAVDSVVFESKLPCKNIDFKLPIFSEIAVELEKLGTFKPYTGVTFEMIIKPNAKDQILLSNIAPDGAGVEIKLTQGRLCISLCDRLNNNIWFSDSNMLKNDSDNHIAITLDGGPSIITMLINGVFNDGGDERQFGWGRFNPALGDLNTSRTTIEVKETIMPEHASLNDVNRNQPWSIGDDVSFLRVHNRALLSSEVVRNYHCINKI